MSVIERCLSMACQGDMQRAVQSRRKSQVVVGGILEGADCIQECRVLVLIVWVLNERLSIFNFSPKRKRSTCICGIIPSNTSLMLLVSTNGRSNLSLSSVFASKVCAVELQYTLELEWRIANILVWSYIDVHGSAGGMIRGCQSSWQQQKRATLLR